MIYQCSIHWKGRRIDDLSRGLRSLTKDSHGPEWSESSNCPSIPQSLKGVVLVSEQSGDQCDTVGWTHDWHPRQSTGFSPAACYFFCRAALSWRQDYPDVPQLKCGRLPVACIADAFNSVGFVAEVSALIVGRCILPGEIGRSSHNELRMPRMSVWSFARQRMAKSYLTSVKKPLRVAYNINNTPLMKAGGALYENRLLLDGLSKPTKGNYTTYFPGGQAMISQWFWNFHHLRFDLQAFGEVLRVALTCSYPPSGMHVSNPDSVCSVSTCTV